jgi:hypothetical protein
MAQEKDSKKATEKCFESIGLDPDLYRCGHTKARIIFIKKKTITFYNLIWRMNPLVSFSNCK